MSEPWDPPTDAPAWVEGEPLDLPFPAPAPAPVAARAVEPVDFDPVLLAAALTSVEEAVAELRAQVEEVAPLLSESVEDSLPNLVKAHGEALEAILDLLTAQPGGPWHYGLLQGDRLRALWKELGEWVGWLEDRYLVHLPSGEYELLPCWWRHPVAVELLTALMVAHKATYARKAVQPSFTLVDWHTRALEPVFAGLKSMKVFARCSEQHAEPTRTVRHDPVAFAAWVDEVAPGDDAPTDAPVTDEEDPA